MERIDTETIARRAFDEIKLRFPTLHFVEDEGEPVEISITIPAQPGLTHEVWLCLQNRDELHFAVGKFQVGWFPCTRPERVKLYLAGVTGFLAGEYRVLEHYRGATCVKAQLQAPEGSGWRTVSGYSTIWSLFSLRQTLKVIRNV